MVKRLMISPFIMVNSWQHVKNLLKTLLKQMVASGKEFSCHSIQMLNQLHPCMSVVPCVSRIVNAGVMDATGFPSHLIVRTATTLPLALLCLKGTYTLKTEALRSALIGLKEWFDSTGLSAFDPVSTHGFSTELIEAIVSDCAHCYTGLPHGFIPTVF